MALLGSLVPNLAVDGAAGRQIITEAALAPTSILGFGQAGITEAGLQRARLRGLRSPDLPSIGSGLAKGDGGEFYGLTDRGPNEDHLDATGTADGIFFPLPEFAPAIVRFRVVGTRIEPLQYLPLKDTEGKPITGIPNLPEDGAAFGESSPHASRLPCDPSGLDPEAIQRLPDGRFLLGEEYGPSLVIADARGCIQMRYSPLGRQQAGQRYPGSAILPASLLHRRRNRGFESVALSPNGKTAYAILESPLGDASDPGNAASRVLRAIKVDLSNPLRARVIGEYLVLTGSLKEFPGTAKQGDIKASDAAWLANDRIVLIVRGKGLVRLMLVDFRNATDVQGQPDAVTLAFERNETDLAKMGAVPARMTAVFASNEVPEIDQDKLEGLSVLGPDQVALISDNDFGLGDNTTGAPCKLWKVRLRSALPH